MTRFWREEREDGAIYNAYLKKVTYHTLSEVRFSWEADSYVQYHIDQNV